jgi:hypothetical protein
VQPDVADHVQDGSLHNVPEGAMESSGGIKQVLSLNLIKYLREFKSICKTVLAHESGDPGVQFNEKNRRSKNS